MSRLDANDTLRFLRLDDECLLEQHATKMPGWVYQSGPRFFSTLFGDRHRAEATLSEWLRRSTSEFSGHRATLAFNGEEAVGMFIALPGGEILPCRRADLLSLIQSTGAEDRSSLRDKLEQLGNLTAPVTSEDYYIRTVAIDEGERGRGFGRQFVERLLDDARAAGFGRIRLDVDADNNVALRLYHSFGFNRIAEGAAPTFGLRMYSMLREPNE